MLQFFSVFYQMFPGMLLKIQKKGGLHKSVSNVTQLVVSVSLPGFELCAFATLPPISLTLTLSLHDICSPNNLSSLRQLTKSSMPRQAVELMKNEVIKSYVRKVGQPAPEHRG